MEVDQDVLYGLVGEHVRECRTRRGLSQAKLARRLGMSRTSVVNIEAGRQHPPLHVVWAIAEELEAGVTELLPKLDEYQERLAPVRLDTSIVSHIEEVANGDLTTKRDLMRFIARAQTKDRRTP